MIRAILLSIADVIKIWVVMNNTIGFRVERFYYQFRKVIMGYV